MQERPSLTACIQDSSTTWGLILLLWGSSFAFAQQYSIYTIAGGAPPSTPVAATSTSIGPPQRITNDSFGNVYFTSLNCVFKIDSNGVLTLIAGTSRPGYSGDGGPATNARLNGPQGVAVDSFGNVYISDSLNSSIRMISTSGIITTIAGYGEAGYTGDGGLATYAQLNLPGGIALDGSGNLYVADSGNNVIRLITTAGTIITFAGKLYPGYSGDGGAATAAQLYTPSDVAVDSSGNVYIADTVNAVIRQVTTDGNIHTSAGSNVLGSTGDGGAATSAELNEPQGVAVDSSGNLYISEFGDSKIREVVKGIINTIAGTGSFGYSGDGSAATKAQMADPLGISVDRNGNIYIADIWNYRVRKISSGNIGTIAGNGLVSYSGDGGPATSAELNTPRGVAMDKAGNLYIADLQNNRVRQITPGGLINTIAGNGTPGYSGDGGQATSAQLAAPQGVAVDKSGNIYIADTGNQCIREVSPNGVIATLAGKGTVGFGGDGGPATGAFLNQPRGVAVDASGNVYVADFNNQRVRLVSPNGTITTLAGNGAVGFSGDGGPAASAELNGPISVAVDASDNVYIADSNNYRVRVVSPSGIINTVAGNGTSISSGDGGPAASATLAAPGSLAADAGGNLYIADSTVRVREILRNGIITTIAGNGTIGYSGDGGAALNAQLNGPAGLAVDAASNVYVADSGNNAIRILQPSGFGVSISSVVNGASLASGPVAPGEVVVIFGSGLGPAQLITSQLGNGGTAPANLAGTTVLFNGAPAQILYTWATQVAVIAPAITGSNAQVVVQYQAQASGPYSVSVASATPGLFTMNSAGAGQAAAVNQDGSLNGSNDPAKVGTIISLFATGVQTSNLTATIGGKSAMIVSSNIEPNSAGGVTQLNVQIPSGVSTGGAVPVLVQEGSASSQTGVTISVSN